MAKRYENISDNGDRRELSRDQLEQRRRAAEIALSLAEGDVSEEERDRLASLHDAMIDEVEDFKNRHPDLSEGEDK